MPDKARERLGRRLREAREYIGLSQEEVAQHLGVPRPAISQMEHGHRRVDALELAMLAKLYQRPLGYFADEEPVGDPPQLEFLRRATKELSQKDREEVLRFAEFLRGRSGPGKR